MIDQDTSHAALRTGLALSGLDHTELFARCAATGSHLTPGRLRSLLTTAAYRTAAEHDTVATALNDYLSEQGLDHPVPLSPEVPAVDPPAEVVHARRVAGWIGADRVAVALTVDGDNRATLRGCDPLLAHLGQMVETIGQGPGVDVLRTAGPSSTPDLHSAGDRWPLLLSTFDAPGQVRSLLLAPVVATGLGAGTAEVGAATGDPDDVLGLLAFSRDRPDPFTPAQVDDAVHAGELIALMLMTRVGRRGTAAADDDALDAIVDDSAHLVPRAVGLLAQQHGVDAVEARRRLHEQAFAAGQTLHQRARHLLRQDS